MKDIELPPLPDADVYTSTALIGYRYSYSKILMQSYARAAIEADRAQRVPEGKVLVGRGELNMVINALRRDAEQGRSVRGEMADSLLASTPAQPAQQSPQRKLSAVDLAKAAAKEQFRHYREVVVNAHQEPPQQERKPMTDEQAVKCIEAAGFKTWTSAHFRLVKQAEIHHGIRE